MMRTMSKIKKIAIVGAGIVGQATGKVLATKGFKVVFIDTNPVVVNGLCGQGYQAFSPEKLNDQDINVFMLAVPTYLPGRKDGLDFVQTASASVGEWLSKASEYCLVVIRSTVIPGTTERIIIPILEECSGKKAGHDFGVCVNPEYLREHRAEEDFDNPWIIVIGELDKRSGDLLQEVYYWANCPIHRMSLKEAEMQKFVHNLSNSTKISFFNEMRQVCDAIGVDSNKIFPLIAQSAEALWNPLYGTADLGPFDGRCLPKDTVAFVSWAKQLGLEATLVDAVIKVNQTLERQLKSGTQWKARRDLRKYSP